MSGSRFALYGFGYFLSLSCWYVANGLMSLAKSGGLPKPYFFDGAFPIYVLVGCIVLEIILYLLDRVGVETK